MSDYVQTIKQEVTIQANGIIRGKGEVIIGRLADDVTFMSLIANRPKQWCVHMDKGSWSFVQTDYWKYCPICGAERSKDTSHDA